MIRWQGDHLAVELPGAHGLFTTRRGGVSEGPYATLNLGDHVGDDPAAVAENRARVGAIVADGRKGTGPGWSLRSSRQVHGSHIATEPAEEADGQVVTEGGATVFVADCLPILLAAEGAAAAVHAGWRGLADGIAAKGVEAVRAAGGTGPLHAALGPSARGCCYEVGEEVHARFPGARRGGAQATAERPGTLDLAWIARQQLEQAGVDWIHDNGLCTMCSEPSLFFSHRRDGGTTGRQAGIVWRA